MSIHIYFADDSHQKKPSRSGMNSLIATGSIRLNGEILSKVNRDLENLCNNFGFPLGEEFKWSPGRELWMHDNLVDEQRKNFFTALCAILQQANTVATVVIEDTKYNTATTASSHEMDTTKLLIERIEYQCMRLDSDALIITDRPGGKRHQEDRFLSECLETLQAGTEYVKPSHIAHNVVSTPSRLSRILQAADVVTGCTLAFVSGEQTYSPPIFELIHKMLDRDGGRIGGIGLKLHPDLKFLNLYHWLVRDIIYRRNQETFPIPNPKFPYVNDPFIP